MALTLANLLTEYKLAIRDSNETDANCYAALNSVKDEFQNIAIPLLGGNALNTSPSSFSITLSSGTYSYSLSTASPAIGRIIEVKANMGGVYRPCRQVDRPFYEGMAYDSNPEYRISGGSLEVLFEPSGTVVVYYAPQIATVSASYTGTSTTQSYQIDEVDRAWCWYAAARHFEARWELNVAGACRMIAMNKLQSIPRGLAV